MDEFQTIARLLRPLAAGAPEAFDLRDDAAALPSRPGYDLIVTADAMVEGVHFLPADPPDLIARKLIRVNLSDLAAKGAEPYGYMLTTAWSPGWDEARRTLFAQGLAEDQAAFGLKLFGGDTVSTPGPLTLAVTMMGWVPSGGMVRRSGARPGDVVLVSGSIGDGVLGLKAARGEMAYLPDEAAAALALRYRLPEPRLALAPWLLRHASGAADVSDGLLADLVHIAEASGVGVEVALDRLPLSPAAALWLAQQPDRRAALISLATGGDDYEIVCTASPAQAQAMMQGAQEGGLALAAIGAVTPEPGLRATCDGEAAAVQNLGWRHG